MGIQRYASERIGKSELWCLLVAFLLGSSMLLFPGTIAEHDAWAVILAGMVGGLGIALVYLKLYLRFPGLTFVAICRQVYGRFAGGVIGLAFSGYLLHVGSTVMTNFADYLIGSVFPRAPEVVGLALTAVVVTYAVTSGVEVMARCSVPIALISLAVIALDSVLLVPRVDLRNLLPILEARPVVLGWGAFGVMTFPFGETVAFMMVFPATEKPGLTRTVLSAMLFVGGTFAIAMVRNAAVLGRALRLLPYVDIAAVRMIDIGGIISRGEVLITAVLLGGGLLKLAVLLHGSALGMAQALNLRSFRPLVHPLAALGMVLALLNFNSVYENVRFAVVTYPVYGLFFQLVLPGLTLLLAMVRRLPTQSPKRGHRANRAADLN